VSIRKEIKVVKELEGKESKQGIDHHQSLPREDSSGYTA
jgi:hypothetical protein